MDKRRMYIFNGHNIANDNYEEEFTKKKFDQVFDYNDTLNKTNIKSANSTFKQPEASLNQSYQNFLQSNENFHMQATEDHKSDYKSTQYVNVNLLPEDLITGLKEHYYKVRGMIENKPDTLFNFFNEFKTYPKRGLKIPQRIQGMFSYTDKDIYYSLRYYYDMMIKSAAETKTSTVLGTRYYRNSTIVNKFKTKFTPETLKRLYPIETKGEVNNINNMDRFVSKLITAFKMVNKTYTNDESELINFWLNFPEKEKFSLKWEAGDKNLEAALINFFTEDKIISRLVNIFSNVCNYECHHPRPLHDYWAHQLSTEDKYLKGLNKFDSDIMYRLLEDRYKQLLEEKKLKANKEEQERKKEEEIKKDKHRVTKDKYEKLKTKFNQLAKPKDKWRTGRVLLSLKKQFQYDNIIHKMIKYEFKENRPFKFAEEYGIYDRDEERKVIFRNQLEKSHRVNENEEKIKEMLHRTKYDDDDKKRETDNQLRNKLKQDASLEQYIKKMVIKYYNTMKDRLSSGKVVLIHSFLTEIYQFMLRKHKEATKRRFGKNITHLYGIKFKKKKRYVIYPREFKFYFFQLIRRLGINSEGKFVFAKGDNLSFWAPTLSNDCKVHGNNCPPYCKHNTHNDFILEQRTKNYEGLYKPNQELKEDERLNLWKREDLIKQKQKIFLCFSEAEHCTFEPRINKRDEPKNATEEDIVARRVNNKQWVSNMGENFSQRFPLVYKDGICKKAGILFQEGKFTDAVHMLEKAFDLDAIRCHFDPKFAANFALKAKEAKPQEENIFQFASNKKKPIEKDNFRDEKNLQICAEVYSILKEIDEYKTSKKKDARKLKKEIKIINDTKKELATGATNKESEKKESHQISYIKDKYFKFFKTIMCPLKTQCPYDLRPRWPHSDIKANTPFGLGCPYAHHISELKFEQEIKEKIKLRLNLIKKLENDDDPVVVNEWVPTGPIIPCTGCGKTFTDKSSGKGKGSKSGAAGGPKGLCGFCRYNQKNALDFEKDREAAKRANSKILIDYKSKPEEWDQDYMKKFGMLKKANVLYSFRRYTEAKSVIDKLKEIIKSEDTVNIEKFKALDKKWRAKLQIKEEIPKEILNYEITPETIDYFKLGAIPFSTLLLYIEKMRKGNNFSIYNRHTYLNSQILEFDKIISNVFRSIGTDVKNISKSINELQMYLYEKEKLKKEDPVLWKKCVIKYKAEMCPNIKNGGRCTESFTGCKFAHNSNSLNLTQPKNKKKLLESTLQSTKGKLKDSRALTAWSYPRSGIYEKGPRYETRLVNPNRRRKIIKRSHSETRCRTPDIHKLKIKSHEI